MKIHEPLVPLPKGPSVLDHSVELGALVSKTLLARTQRTSVSSIERSHNMLVKGISETAALQTICLHICATPKSIGCPSGFVGILDFVDIQSYHITSHHITSYLHGWCNHRVENLILKKLGAVRKFSTVLGTCQVKPFRPCENHGRPCRAFLP